MNWDFLDNMTTGNGESTTFLKFNPGDTYKLKFIGEAHICKTYFDDNQRIVLGPSDADERAKEQIHCWALNVDTGERVIVELKRSIAQALREFKMQNDLSPAADNAPVFSIKVEQSGDWKTRRYSVTPLVKPVDAQALAKAKQDLPDLGKYFEPNYTGSGDVPVLENEFDRYLKATAMV